jgi:hypothetical protein
MMKGGGVVMWHWGIGELIGVVVCLVLIVVGWQGIGFVNRSTEEEERQFEHDQDFDPRRVRLATVHTRQDIAYLCYLMNWVVNLLAVLTGLVAAYVIQHW